MEKYGTLKFIIEHILQTFNVYILNPTVSAVVYACIKKKIANQEHDFYYCPPTIATFDNKSGGWASLERRHSSGNGPYTQIFRDKCIDLG